jgi:hypothetical protein
VSHPQEYSGFSVPKRSWIYIDGKAYEKGVDELPQSHHIIPEIQPYKSMITGEMITSRAKHRDHLKRHGCQEVGNEPLKWKPTEIPDVNPQGRKELIRAQIDSMSQRQFKEAIRKDVQRVKWETNY